MNFNLVYNLFHDCSSCINIVNTIRTSNESTLSNFLNISCQNITNAKESEMCVSFVTNRNLIDATTNTTLAPELLCNRINFCPFRIKLNPLPYLINIWLIIPRILAFIITGVTVFVRYLWRITFKAFYSSIILLIQNPKEFIHEIHKTISIITTWRTLLFLPIITFVLVIYIRYYHKAGLNMFAILKRCILFLLLSILLIRYQDSVVQNVIEIYCYAYAFLKSCFFSINVF